MPLVIIFGTLFMTFALSLAYAAWYHNKKFEHANREGAQESVTVSELHEMIHRAVEEAVRPIERRLEALEAAGDGPGRALRLPDHTPIDLLDDVPDETSGRVEAARGEARGRTR